MNLLRMAAWSLVVGLLAACSAPSSGMAGSPASSLLYVANGRDGTITRLNRANGQVVGPPIPAGTAPWQLVPGPSGSVLVHAVGPPGPAEVTHLQQSGGVWQEHPVQFEPGAKVLNLAGDGGRFAVAVYKVSRPRQYTPEPWRLAVLDTESGEVVRSFVASAPGETPLGLAVDHGVAGLTAYLALWEQPADDGTSGATGHGRVVALDAETGTPFAERGLTGQPGDLVMAPAPGHAGRRLYSLEALPSSASNIFTSGGEYAWNYATASAWRLLGLDPETLDLASAQELTQPLTRLAVAPDGAEAYAYDGRSDSMVATRLLRLDLTTGAVVPFAQLPQCTLGSPAVDAQRVWLAVPERNEVWAVDRQYGQVVQTIAVGRRPLGLVAANAS